jgi:L-threonylcarbamoyladenylate synthase
MKTRVTRLPRVAAGFIEHGEVVAFPTETVYGLGAALFNEDAIRKVFRAKGRPADNPLIAHVASREQILVIARTIPPIAEKLIEAFFPGPITLVLPRHPSVPRIATAGLDTIGVRMPRHAIAQELISYYGSPLAAPSANLSGQPSPTRWQDVKADLDGRIACILKGDQTEVGLESTVVDCTGKSPVVLRAGAVTLEDLESVAGTVKIARHRPDERPKSPGMKYRHYAPKARVRIVDHPDEIRVKGLSAYIGLTKVSGANKFQRIRKCDDLAEYARAIFSFFRDCDAAKVEDIYCQKVPEEGLGLAIMDRLRRAS